MNFQETKVEFRDTHEQLALPDLEKGESIWFLWLSIREANSPEYGPFQIIQGLKLDQTTSNEQDFISTSSPASFIPNTMLKNAIENGGLIKGFAYKIVKAWNKDDKFAGGKKAKGHGFELYKLAIPEPLLNKLHKRYEQLTQAIAAADTDTNTQASKSSAKHDNNMPTL